MCSGHVKNKGNHNKSESIFSAISGMFQTYKQWLPAFTLLIAMLVGLHGKHVQADELPMQGVIKVSSVGHMFARVNAYPKLLEATETKNTDIRAFTKWTGMLARFEKELKQAENVAVIQEWQKQVNAFQGQSMKDMARNVNQLANQKRYILDQNNWGKSDYWATPVEFLQRGGDCEDFAIAKYVALRSLGVPEERLRIAIVQDTVKNIPHAVLVIYTNEGAFILDNQTKTLMDAEKAGRYAPIFSINRQAWWLHHQQAQVSDTQLASAN